MTHFSMKYLAFCAILCAALVALVVTESACAQATSGTIQGRVTDASGAVIPGAIVSVRDEDKGVTFTGRSGGAGEYACRSATFVGRL